MPTLTYAQALNQALREEMRRRRISEAGKAVDEAFSAVERARAQVAEKAKALQGATLSNEQQLRDEHEAAQARTREAEERLKRARERLKALTDNPDSAAPKSP